MRNLLLGVMVLLGLAGGHPARAENGPSAVPRAQIAAADPLRALFERLDLHLIAPARAAQCKDEGEACKSSAECCSGLECSDDPQPSCRPPE